jgi:hypothetical protein
VPIGALAAAAGLRRIPQDVINPEALKRAADLAELGALRRAAGGRGMHGPAGAVGVEGLGQSVAVEDIAQRAHDAERALAALEELGVEQPLGGIVNNRDEGVTGLGPQREPGRGTAIQMQELSEAGPRLLPPAIAAAGPALRQQPPPLVAPA